MIDKLIEKYYNKQSDDEVITYNEIIKDLENLKKQIKETNITSINAPFSVGISILKDKIIGVDIDE